MAIPKTNEYLHTYEHEDGTTVTLRNPFKEPTQQFREAMKNQWYEFIYTERNPEN